LSRFGNPIRAPYPNSRSTFIIHLSEASPKTISERTSYLQVRLVFLRYPHLIPAFFNIRGFGPPVRFTALSPWTWIGHLVSGRQPHPLRPLQTRFRCASTSSVSRCMGSSLAGPFCKRYAITH